MNGDTPFSNERHPTLYQRDPRLIVEGQERAAPSKFAYDLRDVLEAVGFTRRFWRDQVAKLAVVSD